MLPIDTNNKTKDHAVKCDSCPAHVWHGIAHDSNNAFCESEYLPMCQREFGPGTE